MERSNSEERDQIDRPPVPHEDEAASEPGTSSEAFQSDDWWRATAPESDWAQPVSNAAATEVEERKEVGTADVYFCGRTNLFPLNLAIRAIGKENLTGLLRACWDQEPIDVLARDGEILFATTRDLDLYCPETPSIVANVDPEVVDQRSRSAERKRNSFSANACPKRVDRAAAGVRFDSPPGATALFATVVGAKCVDHV